MLEPVYNRLRLRFMMLFPLNEAVSEMAWLRHSVFHHGAQRRVVCAMPAARAAAPFCHSLLPNSPRSSNPS
jgi:hypothetical protein